MRSGLISVLHSGIQQLVNFGKMPSAIFPKHYNWSYMHLKIHFDLNKALCYFYEAMLLFKIQLSDLRFLWCLHKAWSLY